MLEASNRDMGHAVSEGRKGLYPGVLKRALDVVLSLLVLPFFGLLCLALVPAIRLADGGPALYVARRLGKNGRTFRMYKFRSMKPNAPDVRNPDGSTYSGEDDPRLTRLGRVLRKTSLDELPQLLNVLKGDMSVIGPRPDLPQQIQYYQPADHEKLTVRPGLTGYSQAYYRNAIPWEKRLELDVYYARNLSFLLDCRIFFKTVQTVLMRRGIHGAQEAATSEAVSAGDQE